LVVTEQLSFSDLFDDAMTDAEREGIVRDFLSRYSDTETTTATLRPKPCACDPHGLPWWDGAAYEPRCARCGRVPS
jgi:hypothetical protein